MCNSYKTVRQLIEDLPALSSYLSNAGSYFAHLSSDHVTQTAESLEEHVTLVNKYLIRLVEIHKLDSIIDNLISHYLKGEDLRLGNYIKRLFVNAIVFHDFGKVNERFQFEKMKNESFKDKLNSESPINSTHSALSAFIYLTKHLNEIAVEYRSSPLLVTACIYLSYSIFKHHSRYWNDDCLETTDFHNLKAIYKQDFLNVKNYLSRYLELFGYTVNPKIVLLIGENDKLNKGKILNINNSFSLYALCRLNFSLLTAADYLATNEYMNSQRIEDFGVLPKERIEEIYRFVSQSEWINEKEGKRNYNKDVFDKLDDYKLTTPTKTSGKNLNVLRTEMAIEVLRNIRKHYKNNLFYIEAPTGGGKTNLSALASLELLKLNYGAYNKVFYVFPFTTLITQTYKSIKDTFGLKDDELVELHSYAGIKMHELEDDNYGSDQLNYINHLFVNYPFVFLSHIRFFDILKTNEKETNYLLHRIANSIVIIDELQSYNPQHWDKVIYFITQYAKKFNVKFILMSATLPKLDKLNIIQDRVQDFVYLIPEAKKKYFNNPNFSGRLNFNFELFEREDLTLKGIAKKLLDESKSYAEKDFGAAKPKGSVYTIIELIYKKTASEFYELIKDNNFFDEVFVLSGTILPHRRKYIINFLKNKNNRTKKILLITTQVVEAGVDIDMDLGFKDRSLIDSDEQLAGRINRNVNKKECKLFLFNYDKESTIYGGDKRLELTRKHIDPEQYKEILNNKDFDRFYDIVINDRDRWNNTKMVQNFKDYECRIEQLKFKSVHDNFKLIEQLNISCFVPAEVPVEVDGVVDNQKDSVFTKSELEYLKKKNVFPNNENKIEGSKVFDIYLDIVKNKTGFIEQKISEKTLQGIMSKFTFSLFATTEIKNQIARFSNKEKSDFGIYYLEHWGDFYNVDFGMNDKTFNSNESQFL